MKNPTPAGKFIVIGGCEGSGKTSQVELLKSAYPDMVFTREPGGTEFAENGPRFLMLKSSYAKDLNGYEHMTQVFSGRSHLVRKVIVPAVQTGKHVLSDRFDCCSFAIQVFGMENEHLVELFQALRSSIRPHIIPDLYIILDISPDVAMQRTKSRALAKGDSNHFDERGVEFHARVRHGYLRFAELNKERSIVIDASRSKEEVWAAVKAAVESVLV